MRALVTLYQILFGLGQEPTIKSLVFETPDPQGSRFNSMEFGGAYAYDSAKHEVSENPGGEIIYDYPIGQTKPLESGARAYYFQLHYWTHCRWELSLEAAGQVLEQYEEAYRNQSVPA